MNGRELMSLAFRLIGLIFLGFAAVALVGSLRFTSSAVGITATVVDVRTEQSTATFVPPEEGSGITYYPVIEYTGPDGIVRQFEGRAGSQRAVYTPGDSIAILVSESNPESARVNAVFSVWGRAIVTGGLGVGFLLIGLLAPLGFGGAGRAGEA